MHTLIEWCCETARFLLPRTDTGDAKCLEYRDQQFHADELGMVFVAPRCIRRAWLAGEDPLTGKDFSFRKEWIRRRLKALAEPIARRCNNQEGVYDLESDPTNHPVGTETHDRISRLCVAILTIQLVRLPLRRAGVR